MRIGFIGLGSMGAPIARRLARSGFPVTASDISARALEAFDEPGSRREADPVATARDSDVLGICVLNDAQVESVLGDGRVFEALGEGGTVILNSTVSPDLARKLAEQAKQHGVGFLDVGVSGGGPAALEGKLSLFVGGDAEVVERVRPVLDAIGTLAHLGPVGRGLEGKLLNNLVSVANYGMSAAILDLGDRLNFDRQELRGALTRGSAQSFALQAVPGLVGWREGTTAKYLEAIHDLLAKDVVHAQALAPADDPAMAALQAACQAMLARVERAVAEHR